MGMKSLLKLKSSVGWAICLLLLSIAFTGFGQDRSVTGKIISADDGQGVPGVSISVKGTNRGTTSDANGNYKIAVGTNSTLVFSAIGFNAQELSVNNRSVVDVKLITDVKSIDEVVVVGYGTQKKSQLTGAISQVSAKQISEMPITNLGQALQGRTAGVDVSQ